MDSTKRMWNKGWKVTYYPRAAILHTVGGSSERNLTRSIFEFHKSAYIYSVKYVKSSKLVMKPLIIAGLSFRFFGILILQSLRPVARIPKLKLEPFKNILTDLAN